MNQLDGYYVMWGTNLAQSEYFSEYTAAMGYAVDLPDVPIIVLMVETIDSISRTTIIQSFSINFR